MERREKLVECSFLIPLVRDSDRQPHQPIAWRELQDSLFKAFSGSTHSGPELYRAIRPTQGDYKSVEGQRVEDESYRYVVAVPESSVGELRAILRQAALWFDQESIYLAVAGYVEFVPRQGPESEVPS